MIINKALNISLFCSYVQRLTPFFELEQVPIPETTGKCHILTVNLVYVHPRIFYVKAVKTKQHTSNIYLSCKALSDSITRLLIMQFFKKL